MAGDAEVLGSEDGLCMQRTPSCRDFVEAGASTSTSVTPGAHSQPWVLTCLAACCSHWAGSSSSLGERLEQARVSELTSLEQELISPQYGIQGNIPPPGKGTCIQNLRHADSN